MKGSALVDTMPPVALTFYARLCGWTLARAHARSGDPVAMAEYLGGSDAFDRSILDFCERYADQNEKDYEEFAAAVKVRAPGSSRGSLMIGAVRRHGRNPAVPAARRPGSRRP